MSIENEQELRSFIEDVIARTPARAFNCTLSSLPTAMKNKGVIIFVSDHTAGSGLAISDGAGTWTDVTTNTGVA